MHVATIMKMRGWLGALLMLSLLIWGSPVQAQENNPEQRNGVQVLEAFDKQQEQRTKNDLNDHEKQVIQFAIGAPLLLLLLLTAGLGIATGVYGKKLFLAHMICAGLTITLAIVHVIVGLVWFYPF